MTALTWPERLRALYRGNRVLSPSLHGELADHIAALEAAVERLQGEHEARRGSDVEAWIKRYREQFRDSSGALTGAWYAIDGLLDDYREHADCGVGLGEKVTGPHPEES